MPILPLTPLASPAPAHPLAAALQTRPTLCLRDRRLMVGTVACAHLLGLWALLQVDSVQRAVRDAAPLVVDLLAPPAANRPAPAPPPPRATTPPLQQAPLLAAPTPQAPPADTFVAPAPAIAPAIAPAPTAPLLAAAVPPAPPLPAVAAAPPPRKVVDATVVRYLAEPPAEVPRASRRAGEHGVVWLRVVVSAQGLPLQVSLSRSSGYGRLDEQALWAMRQSRFKPHTENGQAVEIEVIAPVEYPQD